MASFYDEICATTKIVDDHPSRTMVKIYIDEVFEFLIQNWKMYVKIAALSGYKQAYLGIYSKTFKIREYVNLYDYFNPSEEAIKLFKRYEQPTLEEKLINEFNPFVVELQDTDDKFLLTLHWN